MLSKIYTLFFVVGAFGSALSIARPLLNEEESEASSFWKWPDQLGIFFFYTSFIGIFLLHIHTFTGFVNALFSIFAGLFFTYYSHAFFKSSCMDQKRGSFL